MGDMIGRIFGGGKDKAASQAAAAQAAQQQELQRIAQLRQQEQVRTQQQDTAQQTKILGAPARGRRLLTYAGGEDGTQSKLGG